MEICKIAFFPLNPNFLDIFKVGLRNSVLFSKNYFRQNESEAFFFWGGGGRGGGKEQCDF